MDRRSFIGSAAAASLASVSVAAVAAEKSAGHNHTHMNHTHHAMPMHSGLYDGVLAAAGKCVVDAEVCLAHCIRQLSEGDQSMAECAKAVNQMLALCKALESLAAQRSPLTPVLAKLCIEACKQCADACKEHAPHHAECKACYESCLACIEACEKVAVK